MTRVTQERRPRWATSITVACLLVVAAYVATPSLYSRIVLSPLVLVGKAPSMLDARDYRHQEVTRQTIVAYGMLVLCAVFYSMVIQWLTTRIARRGAMK
jgi:hypothetical protein